jgi:hypothetical protein
MKLRTLWKKTKIEKFEAFRYPDNTFEIIVNDKLLISDISFKDMLLLKDEIFKALNS